MSDYDLNKIKSSKTREILKDALDVANSMCSARAADKINRLIRSRIAANATNSALTAELVVALAEIKQLKATIADMKAFIEGK